MKLSVKRKSSKFNRIWWAVLAIQVAIYIVCFGRFTSPQIVFLIICCDIDALVGWLIIRFLKVKGQRLGRIAMQSAFTLLVITTTLTNIFLPVR